MTSRRGWSSGASERGGSARLPPIPGPDSLSNRLDSIGAGLLLRRQLDASVPSEEVEISRRELLRVLTELQECADVEMASLVPGTERHDLVARRAREWLDDVRAALRNVTSGAPAQPAAAGDGHRGSAKRAGVAERGD